MTVLPGPEKPHELQITLKLVEELEAAYGSLYLVAQNLLDKSLPLCEMVDLLKILYRHAGCDMEEAALGEFLLRQPCTGLLITVLLEILQPVERSSASAPPARFMAEMLVRFPDQESAE